MPLPASRNQLPHLTTNLAQPVAAQSVTVPVLFFPGGGAAPEFRAIPTTLEAMEALVGGRVAAFETSAGFDVIAIASAALNRRGLLISYQRIPNRRRRPNDLGIEGPFFIVGTSPGFRTLRQYLRPLLAREVDEALRDLAFGLPRSAFWELMAQTGDGAEWMAIWRG
jgi:hypothetical protein